VKFIGRAFLGVVAIVVVMFALANRGPVTLSLWPFAEDLSLPLYLVVLGAMVLGLATGGVISWLPKQRLRRRARSSERRVAALESAAGAPTPSAPQPVPAPAGASAPARYRPALNDE
jgi:uncharacterized integral membrane protein